MIKKITICLFLLTTTAAAQQAYNKLSVKELDVTSRVDVTSTTKSSKPCPVMTETQRNAIGSPANGSCIYNSTTSKLNVYNGTIWKAAGGGVDNWATSTVYAVNDIVIQSNKIYQCLIAHTSGVFATDLAASRWIEISTGVTDHTALTSIGTNTHAQIDTHIGSTSNPHSVTKSQVGLGSVVDADTTTTANITDSSNKRFVTDANLTTIGNTSGTNTGDNATNTQYSGLATSKQDTLFSGTNIKTINTNSILGSGDLTIGAVNLTGPITSVGAATSIASQTGTGSTFVVQNTPTLTTPNIGAATGTSLTLAGNISAYNYDKDNLLVNGNIENPLSSEWTCTVGTCTRTTTSGEFSKDTAALKVALSAQAMNVSQTVTTPSGIQKQGFVRVIYRVPATMANFQVCTLVDAAEQTCIPTNNLIKDDTFRTAEIPLIFGATSAGIKFKTTSAYTATAYFDGVILAQGLGTQNLQLDNVYSAKVSGSAVVSDENTEWITGNGSFSSGDTTLTFKSGLFTVAPTCVSVTSVSATITSINTVSSSSVIVRTKDLAGADTQQPFRVICQKSGNDYLAASANVYAAQSANYDWTSYTPTTPNSSFAAAPTGITVGSNECQHKREGSDLLLRCKFTTGTTAASEGRISLPSGLTSADTTKIPTTRVAGMFYRGSSTASATKIFTTLIEPSVTYITYGSTSEGGTTSPLTKLNGNAGISSTQDVYFDARIPISGWSNSNVIVGSFEGIEKCKDNGECDDTFGAQVTTTSGSVSNENREWITSCTAANPTVCTISGFTVAPNCVATSSLGGNVGAVLSSATTSTSFTVRTLNSATGADNGSTLFHVSCQKTGVDYKPKTAKIADPTVLVPTVSPIAGVDIDWNILTVLNGLYTKTLSANTTFTFSNLLAGQAINVRLTNTASNYTVTWPTVKWSAGATPVMTIGAKSDIYSFYYDGTNIFGAAVQNY